jgi:hypothetical protein
MAPLAFVFTRTFSGCRLGLPPPNATVCPASDSGNKKGRFWRAGELIRLR